MAEYAIYFRKAKGDLRPKVFQIKESVWETQQASLEKKHSFKLTTTRKLYLGEHKIVIIINGKEFNSQNFSLQKSS